PVGSVGVDLVAFQFGAFPGGRVHNYAPGDVYLARHLIRPGRAVPEDLAQHLDDVGIGVVVVVEQNDMVPRQMDGFGGLPFLLLFDLFRRGWRFDGSRSHDLSKSTSTHKTRVEKRYDAGGGGVG